MNWTKRGAKVLASYITGYSGGIAVMFPLSAIHQWSLDLTSFLAYPVISGFVVALPQLSKVLTEYAGDP